MNIRAAFCLSASLAALAPASAVAKPAPLADASGKVIGSADLVSKRGMTHLRVRVYGLQAGVHGLHIHAIGTCEGPAFASAGPHWNPAGKQHGRDNPMGSHAGDLPNLVINAKGKGRIEAMLHGVDPNALLDADGAAIVLHAAADDLKTDPTGNSGARIACAVLAR